MELFCYNTRVTFFENRVDMHINQLLYRWLAPLRPSADIPQVGTQKDTYGLRFAQFHYTLVDDERHSLFIQLVTLLFWELRCMRDSPY